MKKNGFTLIELLAVIVILAIIALIATPIILGIINDAREESNERSVELYASAIKNGIASYQLRTGNEVASGTYTKETLPFEVEYEGNVECTSIVLTEDGKVSLEGCKVNNGENEYSYGTKQELSACALDDKDGDGVASLSDVITCGTESFYVMYNENNEITMLSMYNLNVGEYAYAEGTLGIQNEFVKGNLDRGSDVYGGVGFSTSSYWTDENENLLSKYGTTFISYVYDENSLIYVYVKEYERILKEDLKVSSARAKLINVEQLEKLGCSYDESSGTCDSAPNWVNSTDYWTGSAINSDALWGVDATYEYCGPDCVSEKIVAGLAHWTYGGTLSSGVRPVITISTSEIQ